MTEPKKCPTGKYWCFTDKKCKKIPKGYHVMGSGRLMKDEDHEDGDENKNGGSNGNGDGGGVSENTILEKRDGKSAKDKGYSLRDWFRGGGWKQTGGKYDGKPCARQPGQKTKPFCRDADDRAAMSKKERNRRAAKKRREDPNPDRKGKAKIVTDSYTFSNWRKETNLQESDWTPVTGSIANSSDQTFHYVSQNFETGEPNIATISGLGGVEAAPSEVTVDLGFGEKYPVAAPDYSQSSMQGYAQPLTKVQKRQDEEENEKIDAEIKKLLTQIDQLDQKRSDLGEEQAKTEPQYTGMSHSDFIDRTNEINAKWSDKMWPLQKKLNDNPVCIAADKCVGTKSALMRMNKAATKEHENLYDEYMRQTSEFQKAQDDHIKSYSKKLDSIRKEKEALNAKIAELEKQRPINNQLDASQQVDPTRPYMGARVQPVAGQPSFNYDPPKTTDMDKFMDGWKNRWQNTEGPGAPGTGAEGQWWISMMNLMDSGMSYNDASKQVGPRPPRVGSARVQPSPALRDYRNTSPVSGLIPNYTSNPDAPEHPDNYVPTPTDSNVVTPDDEGFIKSLGILPKGVNSVMSGYGFAGDAALRYAKGDYTPVTKSPGRSFDKKVLDLIQRSDTPGAVTDIVYSGDIPSGISGFSRSMGDLPVRLSLGQFNYKVTSNGIEVRDTFNFNANRSIGALASLGLGIGPALQNTADRLVDIGNKRARSKGLNPDDESFGIPIKYTIPWSQVPAKLQNKLDPTQTKSPIVKTNRRGRKRFIPNYTPTPDAKQVGEDLNRRDRKVIGKMVADSYDFSNWRDEFKALEFETVDIIGTEPLKPTEGLGSKMLGEKCWKGYEKKGMKTMFGKRYPNCVKKEETEIEEKKDPCWDTHKQVGMKKKNGRMVPNCVPKEETHSDWRTEIFEGDGDHEYEMARRQLATIKNAVSRLEKKMGETGEGELKAWVQAKLTRSADDIDTVADYVTNEETIQEGEKDACYHKVKSRYSVWPSAYASGALVKCRKVGAKNWGNKSKTKKEEVQYLNTEDYQRIQEYGNVYTIIVLWRGKSHRLQLFFQGTARPSRDEVKHEVEKIYPGGMVSYYFPSAADPGKPIIVSTRS